jgi:two-component system, NarL family, nitrate/nitrite response regulator NarL
MRVLVLTDVCLYREGLAHLLASQPGIEGVDSASEVEEALEMLRRCRARVALIDLALPQVFEASRRLAAHFPGTVLIALGVADENDQVLSCAEAGITGYVCRDGTTSDLIEAIRCAAAGELRCSRRIAGALIARVASAGCPRSSSPLTPRETQVVRLVDEGLTNKEIAAQLNISAATARNHIHSILEKLGAKTRTGAVAAMRRAMSYA